MNFSQASEKLRRSGVKLTMAPGEYVVSKFGVPDKEFRTDDLDEAIRYGLEIAAIDEALTELPLGPMGKRSRRGEIYKHNRKIAAKRAKAARDG